MSSRPGPKALRKYEQRRMRRMRRRAEEAKEEQQTPPSPATTVSTAPSIISSSSSITSTTNDDVRTATGRPEEEPWVLVSRAPKSSRRTRPHRRSSRRTSRRSSPSRTSRVLHRGSKPAGATAARPPTSSSSWSSSASSPSNPTTPTNPSPSPPSTPSPPSPRAALAAIRAQLREAEACAAGGAGCGARGKKYARRRARRLQKALEKARGEVVKAMAGSASARDEPKSESKPASPFTPPSPSAAAVVVPAAVPEAVPETVPEVPPTRTMRTVSCSSLVEVPPILITRILAAYLGHQEINSLGRVCKRLRSVCQAQEVWERLFRRVHADCEGYEKNIEDWRTAYRLLYSNACDREQEQEEQKVEDEKEQRPLRAAAMTRFACYRNRTHLYQTILGYPLEVTVNPRLQKIDYISATMDICSKEAFEAGECRSHVTGARIRHWLPLFMTQEHFGRAKADFEKTIRALCGRYHGSGSNYTPYLFPEFKAERVLDVLPKVMTTFVVMLADKGLRACRKALLGFAQIHRLFLAAVQTYPELQRKVHVKIRKFCLGEEARHKDHVPSLGDILPLLCVSDKYRWEHVWKAYLAESFDRSVLWLCRDHPELARLPSESDRKDPDRLKTLRVERLEKSLEGMRIRIRLTMFFVYFFKRFCRGSTAEMASMYDRYLGDDLPHGMPSIESMEADVKEILEVSSWQKVFALLGASCPGEAALVNILESAVRNSERRGYHHGRMNFRRIQRRGVSTLVKRGERYTMGSEMTHITMGLGWTSSHDLDAGLVMFDGESHEMIEIIDFHNLQSSRYRIAHSGDVLNGDNGTPAGEDQEQIFVNLSSLGTKNPPILVFVMSTYTRGVSIRSVRDGFVRLEDTKNSRDGCYYPLDAKQYHQDARAIVLCKVFKSKTSGNWTMIPIGEALDPSKTRDYTVAMQMLEDIKERFLSEDFKNEEFIFKA